MSRHIGFGKRLGVAAVATGLATLVLPWGGGVAVADEPTETPTEAPTEAPTETPTETPTEAPTETPTEPAPPVAPFTGFTTQAKAAPVKLEIYEPTIPLPATPQLEMWLAYSTVKGSSSGLEGRSSFLWPGDPVGSGFKTIMENLGLPPELVDPLAAEGYPVQVNSVHPSGPAEEVDEPFPGMIQRTSAGEGTVVAKTGFSLDGEPADDAEASGESGAPSGAPGLAAGGLPSLIDGVLSGFGGGGGAAAVPAASPIPPELAVLVDVGGFSSVSGTDVGDAVTTRARTSMGDISLLGGLVRIEGLKVLSTASSDGKAGSGEAQVAYGDLVAFGQRFAFGPDGFEAMGQQTPIPGLPDDAAKALEAIGLKIELPKPTREIDGDAATTTASGVVVDLDLTVLKTQLAPVTQALADLVTELPDDLGTLKSLLGAATNLSPRIVLTLGQTQAEVDTSQGIELPDPEVPTEEPTEDSEGGDGDGTTGAGAGAGTSTTPPGSSPPPADAPGGDAAPSDGGVVPTAAPQQPGLPPLFSIPTLLVLGAVAAASVAGSWLRRLGLAALGGASACPHGLDSGLPDLRKVQ